MTYLITGATGAVGRSLIDQLLAGGHAVRAITRKPETANLPAAVAVSAGNFASGEFGDEALVGVRKAFVFPAEGGVEGFLVRAKAAGIEHVVVLSSLAAAAEHKRDIGSASNLHHSAIERAVRETGIAATLLRPGTFANNLLTWAHSIRSSGGVFGPHPRSAQAPIHEADVAAVAAAALTQDGHRHQIYAMTGPEALTRVQQLDAIGAAIGKRLVFHETSPEQFAESMKPYAPAGVVKMLHDYWSDTVAQPDTVRPTVQQVTGRPGRKLSDWARDHAAAFA